MTDHRSFTLDDLQSSSWDRKIVLSIVDELASLPGEKYNSIEEVRRFLTLKSYRELLHRLETAREKKSSHAAVRSIALAVHSFGVERPALFAAACRTPPSEARDCREVCRRIDQLLVEVFAECGLAGQAAHQAVHIFRCLIRGFVLDELLNSFLCNYPYEDSYRTAIDLFIAGLPALGTSRRR
jgi:hypothetical protein